MTLNGVSQVSDSNNLEMPKTIHKLGLHAGTTSGLGLSYKALFNDKYMIQAITLPIASQDFKYINSGLSFKYKFKDLSDWDFYAYGSGNYIFSQYSTSSYDYNTDTYDNSYNIGKDN